LTSIATAIELRLRVVMEISEQTLEVHRTLNTESVLAATYRSLGKPLANEAQSGNVCASLRLVEPRGLGTPDLLHVIHGTPLRTPLLGAFAAGQREITTTRSVPLLSPAVPWLMPQPCPGKDEGRG
jgi:hypothetical protein